MAKSPFYRVYVDSTGEELTRFVDSFSYEESIDKDDLLRLSITHQDVYEMDVDWLVIGGRLRFVFGYIGAESSGLRLAKIANVKDSYTTNALKTTIEATDLGQFLKYKKANTIHKEKTLTTLCEEIADKNGLDTELVQTSRVYRNLPQAGRTDFDLLQELAKRENLLFRMSGTTMILEKRSLSKDSVRTYTFGDGTSEVLSFQPKAKHTNKQAAGDAVKTAAINPQTNQVQVSEAKADAPKKESLGEFRLVWDVNAKTQRRVPVEKSKDNAQDDTTLVSSQNPDKNQNTNKLNRLQEDKALSNIEADLETVGNPLLQANAIITLAGVAKKHQGNYLVASIRHNISTSGYTCSLQLKKNASSKPIGNVLPDKASSQEQEVNKSVGATQSSAAQNKIRRFTADGKEVKND